MTTDFQTSDGGVPGRSSQTYIIATAFLSLFAIVGFALYGLPFFYDFFSKEFGWSRTVVTSGNALGKLLVAPLFGFIAGWLIDKYGPRRMLMAGALLTGAALIGLSMMNSLGFFYLFYVLPDDLHPLKLVHFFIHPTEYFIRHLLHPDQQCH